MGPNHLTRRDDVSFVKLVENPAPARPPWVGHPFAHISPKLDTVGKCL